MFFHERMHNSSSPRRKVTENFVKKTCPIETYYLVYIYIEYIFMNSENHSLRNDINQFIEKSQKTVGSANHQFQGKEK